MNAWNRLLPVLTLLSLGLLPAGAAVAQVKVTSATPTKTTQGTVSLDVVISGSGFDNTAKAQFLVTGTGDTGGVVVLKTTFQNSKQITATIDVPEGATVAIYDIAVTLESGRKGKGTTLFSIERKAVVDTCAGKTPAFIYNKGQPGSSGRFFYLADDTGACQRFLFSVYGGNYDRVSSFRVVDGVGRLVTTDGLERMILVTFPIMADMVVGAVTTRPLFDPANPGFTDNGGFELAQDGHRLVYVTYNEDGQETWLGRIRVLDDVDSCNNCPYEAGALLAERVGLDHSLEQPRFSADETSVWVEDRRGVYSRPYLSRMPATPPSSGLHEPEIMVDGGILNRELRIAGLRSRDGAELLAFSQKGADGCPVVTVVDTAACSNGVCAQVNSASPTVLTYRGIVSFASASTNSLETLVEAATVNKRGECVNVGVIHRAIDTGHAVTSTPVATGVMPSSP